MLPHRYCKKRIVFVKTQGLVPASIGLRSLNKLKSAHGGLYMGVHNDHSQFYFVLEHLLVLSARPKA